MYFGDHIMPHFHAIYAEFSAQISIVNVGIINGHLPPKALALIIEWASMYQEELRINWQSLSENGNGIYTKIEPLK